MHNRRLLQLATAVGLAAVLLLFVLPWFVPVPGVLAESASFRAGYYNSVAIYAASGLALLVFLFACRLARRAGPLPTLPPQPALSRRFVFVVLAASALVYAVSGLIVTASHTRYLGDAGYIIEQATVRLDTGRSLYSQLEFAYGPLLLLPVVWTSRLLHLGMSAAYFVTLVLESTVGLLMVAYLLNALPIRNGLKRPALLLLAIGAWTPHLGLNYTFFRFASPFAILLFALRRRAVWQCAVVLAVGETLVLLISPELGLVLGAGAAAFGLVCAWQRQWPWAASATAPLLVLALFALTVGQPFFHMVRIFAAGALNLPIAPYPHILILLVLLLWVVPFGLGRMVQAGDLSAARMTGLFIVSLALTRAALGRSDPLHVFFDGFGILLLSLVVVSRANARARTVWVAAAIVLVLWTQYVNQRQFLTRTKYVLAQAIAPALLHANAHRHILPGRIETHARALANMPERTYTLGPQLLNRLSSGGCVATPLEVSPRVEQQLRDARIYGPGYYAFGVDSVSPAAEERVVQDSDQCTWMLLPVHPDFTDLNTVATLRYLQGIPLPFRERNRPLYQPGRLFLQNLATHWTPVGTDGPYSFYRRSTP